MIRKCPICKQQYEGWPAISRSGSHQEICPECGRQEAMAIYAAYVHRREHHDEK